MATDFAFVFPQDNLNLLLTEEEMYSLTETFQRCKVIPGKAASAAKKEGPAASPFFLRIWGFGE